LLRSSTVRTNTIFYRETKSNLEKINEFLTGSRQAELSR
jgi:hypothetical protein